MITFTLEKKADENTGVMVDTLVKKVTGKPDEDWCTVTDLDQLFDACVRRWGSNWNLEKVKMAIMDCGVE